MQSFVRNLSISNKDTLQDVVEPCNKILNWLTPHTQSALSYDDVETLIKASIYVEECIVLFGGAQLLKALKLQEPGLEAFYKSQAAILQEKSFIMHTICLILSTVKGEQHLPMVDEILRQVYDKELAEEFIEEAAKKLQELKKITALKQQQQQRLLLVVQQLFQLPASEIEVGISRIIENLHFEVLGYTLLEPVESTYFARCCILSQRIFERCSDGSIPAHFIDSLHQTAAYSNEGLCFYWQCLGNICFARSLRNFCIKYFESIEETPANFAHFNLQHICYLYCMALNIQSPCRLAYQRALNKAKIMPDYLNLIQRHVRIFSHN